jgi:hypothetical protein
MENSDGCSIIKALMEKSLLVIRQQQFIGWLDRLQSTGQITEEEIKVLLQFAEQLKIYDIPIREQLVTTFN